jgi:plastocyanin
MTIARVSAAAMMFALASAGCGDDAGTDPDPTPTGPTITASGANTFVPASLTIQTGQTVTWIFGSTDHDVQFSAVQGAPTNIAISRNRNVARTFGTAGNFPYLCSLHAGMTGTVVVQ